MKKFLTLTLSVLLLVTLAACGGDKGPELKEDHRLYLVTDLGTIDDKSFNQGSYEGLEQYAHEIGVTANYIAPEEQSTDAYLDGIKKAIDAGAEVIVTPGFLFEGAIALAQAEYPDVKFILVDAIPTGGAAENTLSILYKEEQSGFLAGYAAVKEGYTDLGFMGGIAVPAVVRFGYGYVAGADYAAKELGVNVHIKYTYVGLFQQDPKVLTQAESWYQEGTEIIFAAAGGANGSVMQAAANSDAVMIGVDVDQSFESDTVITSATKNLKASVYQAVKAAMEGNFPGGQVWNLGADEDGVALPDNLDRFSVFTKADYDAIFKILAEDTDGVASSIPTLDSHGDKVTALSYDNVTIEPIGE